jgi:hypothetical protein
MSDVDIDYKPELDRASTRCVLAQRSQDIVRKPAMHTADG